MIRSYKNNQYLRVLVNKLLINLYVILNYCIRKVILYLIEFDILLLTRCRFVFVGLFKALVNAINSRMFWWKIFSTVFQDIRFGTKATSYHTKQFSRNRHSGIENIYNKKKSIFISEGRCLLKSRPLIRHIEQAFPSFAC